jgi:hypothetical protein
MALGGERLGQLPGGLAGPAQRALGVAAGVGVDQPIQRLKQAGSVSRRRLGPSYWRMRPRGSAGWSSSATPRAHRRARGLGQARDPADPALAQRPGRRAEQQPALPLGQVRRHQREGRCQHLIQVHTRKPLQPLPPGKVTKRGPPRSPETARSMESPSMGLLRRPTTSEIVEDGRLGRPCGPGAHSRASQKTRLRLRRQSHIQLLYQHIPAWLALVLCGCSPPANVPPRRQERPPNRAIRRLLHGKHPQGDAGDQLRVLGSSRQRHARRQGA